MPFSDIVVLDLSILLPGPFCTLVLSDLGAEVIKIEEPKKGDPARYILRPGYFEGVNRNKKSVGINLKSERGKEILFELAKEADVLVENFRPGVTERLGVSYKDISAVNPRIIYLSISGFGQSGPYKERPAHDITHLGICGVLSLSGDPNSAPPQSLGVSISDLSSALLGVISLISAIRFRDRYGLGQYIDLSMVESVFYLMINRYCEYFSFDNPSKSSVLKRSAYGVFKAKCGRYFTLAAVEDHFFKKLAKIMRRDDWIKDPSFVTWRERNERAYEINDYLAKRFLEKPRDFWLDLFYKEGIPASPVNEVHEVFLDPHLRDRDSFGYFEHDLLGKVLQIWFPAKFSKIESKKIRPPYLGEHTYEVLKRFGFGDSDIEDLKKEGVIS